MGLKDLLSHPFFTPIPPNGANDNLFPLRQVDLKSFDVEVLASVVFLWKKHHGTENLNKIDRPPRGWSLISASRLLPLYLMELGALSETDFAKKMSPKLRCNRARGNSAMEIIIFRFHLTFLVPLML